MLPSMPILFTRESQDAFGNKIEPSTSFFNQQYVPKPLTNPEPPLPKVVQVDPKVTHKEVKSKKETNVKKKDDPPKIDDNALETALVRSYYTKVQSRFASNMSLPTNKYVQFQNILKSFDPNKETPVDLYRKIETLFGDEHQDIVEEFLLFLKPGQAVEVGRFMDRFMLVQMTGFIEQLQNTFARKPTVLRKVLRAITTGINTGSSQEMKNRVLPHLRSNPRLTQMFKALFPDERPPDSVYETGAERLNESFLTEDRGYDVWELEDEDDSKRKLDAKERLDTMYLHGRVFLQHGRLLRSARVTYPYSKEPYRVHARRLAPAHCHLSPPDSDEERSPKRIAKNTKVPPKRPKKQTKSPTKNVKDVNDNTKKECSIMSPKAKKANSAKSNIKTCNKKESDKIEVHKKKEKLDLKSKQVKVAPVLEPKKEVRGNWTRDEDKTMLQVLKGEVGSEKIFCRIRELLPHRSTTEIKERFCHVMTLLQQMAVGEVT